MAKIITRDWKLRFKVKTRYEIAKNEISDKYKTRIFTEQVMRRLLNYNRLLDQKIAKFDSPVEIKSRILFLLPDADKIREYLKEKIKEKEKRDRLKKAKMVIKINAALVMTISFILITRLMKRLLDIITRNNELRKTRRKRATRTK